MRLDPAARSRAHPLDRVDGAARSPTTDARAEDVLAGVLAEFPGQVALVSSFGAEAAVLLNMVAEIDRDLPVLMIDSLMLFEETLDYQRDALGAPRAAQRPAPAARRRPTCARLDPDDTLHQRDPDACCDIRKVLPLDRALRRWPVTITGRKRFQASTRAALEVFEARRRAAARSTRSRTGARRTCAPTWTRTTCRGIRWWPGASARSAARPAPRRCREGEDDRAGRWRGSEKVECGIHFGADGRILRAAS